MRLYYHPFSSCARRVRMAAHQLNIALELVPIDLASESARRQLREVNPNEKVPVLEDNGFLLWESCSIMQYLADKTSGQSLYPTELKARADVNRWLFCSVSHFSPAISVLTWENVIKAMIGAGEPDPVEIKRGETDFAENAPVLNAHLAENEWISGNRLTLADFAIAAPLMSMEAAKLPIQDYTHILAWFKRIQTLEAWQKTAP